MTRIHKFLKRRNLRGRISEKQSFCTNSNRFRSPFGVIVEVCLNPSGKTSIQVSFVETRLSRFSFQISHLFVDNYTKLCTIKADLSHLPLTAQNKYSGVGTFYRVDYELALLFGLTEMKAQVIYKDKVRAYIKNTVKFK